MCYRPAPEVLRWLAPLLVEELVLLELRVGVLRGALAEDDRAAGAERVAGGVETLGCAAGAEGVTGLLTAEGRDTCVGVRVAEVDCLVVGAVLDTELPEAEGRLGEATVGRVGVGVEGRTAGALLG